MFNSIGSNLKRGVDKIKNNPQLIYTVFTALIIASAFIYMADKFVGIANDAGDRLVNVRIGSLQDAFVSFAGDKINDPEYLNQKIKDVVASNDTIQSFRVVTKNEISTKTASTTTSSLPTSNSPYKVVASYYHDEVGHDDSDNAFLYTLASSDPKNSLTVQGYGNGGRLFKTARAITDKNGNILGVVIVSQTLSQADQTIQDNINNSIYILIGVLIIIMLLFLRHSRIIDYTALYKKLKEVDQLKDDFISMASHELRTPLASIRGYAEFIREAPELTAETKDYSTKIDISAKELDSLVGDILDVSRIEQGRMSFKFEKINPTEMIQAVTTSLELPAKEKGLKISYENKLPTGAVAEPIINADRDRLKQTLINIIGNAVKYTKAGEVKVSEYIEKGKLYVRVSDTGVGMSEEERKKLFEKFYRIRNDETQDIRGTGLGLWITAQIIKEMKGDISVESIKGVGSHFIISFPLIQTI